MPFAEHQPMIPKARHLGGNTYVIWWLSLPHESRYPRDIATSRQADCEPLTNADIRIIHLSDSPATAFFG